jgi:hypothetical protein
MADLSPLLGEERKSDFGAVRSVEDPDQTLQFSRAREELAELIWINERCP